MRFSGAPAVPVRPAGLALGIHPSHPSGLLLFVACFGYLAFSFTGFLMPQYLNTVAPVATYLGEAPIILWLAIMGARPMPIGAADPSPAAG